MNKTKQSCKHVDEKLLNKLKNKIAVFMDENGINWGNIYKLKIKEQLNYPVSGRTLHNLMSGKSVHVNNVKKLLLFHNVKHKQVVGVLKD